MRRRAGFTLVEALVGAVVLVVGFLPVYLFLFSSEKGTVETTQTVEALAIAEGLVSELSLIPARHLPASGGRVALEDYRSRLKPAHAALLSEVVPALAARHDRSVEVIDGKRARRLRVLVRPKSVAARSDDAGAVVLETLVTR